MTESQQPPVNPLDGRQGGLSANFDLGARLTQDTPLNAEGVLPVAVEAATRLDGRLKEAEYQASHDELTGLLNKKTWRERAEKAVAESDDVAIVFIDLTNFKAINDHAPGRHVTGDKILKQVAERIKGSLRENDLQLASHEQLIQPQESEAGRYGGDEFTILLDLRQRDNDTPLSREERMGIVIDRVRSDLGGVIAENQGLVDGKQFDISIGGAVKQPGMELDQLVIAADHAMEKDKAAQHAQHGSYR